MRQRGLLYTFAILFNRIVPARLFRLGMMDVYRLSYDKLITRESDNEIEIAELPNHEDRKQLKVVTKNGLSEIETQDHYAFGIKPINSEAIIGGLWVAWESFDERPLFFRIKLNSDQAWIYCAYVLPENRGKGCYAACLRVAAEKLVEVNRKDLLVAFNPFNQASSSVHQKYAKDKIGRIYAIRFLGMALCFSQGSIETSKLVGTKQSPVTITLQ